MTQTNTTQNKEELEQLASILEEAQDCHWSKWGDVYGGTKRILLDELNELLSQAHQSGIEEERKRIVGILESEIKPQLSEDDENYNPYYDAAYNGALRKIIKSLKENKQ